MKWSFLRSLFLCLSFTTVTLALVENLNDDLEYDPQVAISCGKVTRHTNVDTGDWIADKNNISLCTGDKTEILKYCQTVYPSKNISNVVEANNRVLVDNSLVTPFRCLVGFFESDALLVPPQCRFEHVHESSECQSHDAWHKRATDKCGSETMILRDYGVLIPCGTGVFTGVEFVCCPSDAAQPATEAVKIVDVSHATAKPLSVLDHLKNEISKFAKNVEPSSVGCDRKKYHDRRDKLEETHRQRVEGLIKQWEQAEKRFKLLKVTDENQATASIAGELENFKSTLASYDDQVKLERNRLKEEHHQCTQIDLNNKKNQALGDFVAALQKEPRDGNKVLEAVQCYVKICTQDRLHNLRYFEYVQKHHPEKTDDARKSLQNHFKLINKLVNESMILLYKLPEIARQFQLDLPDWIPKLPALPTEKPTVAKTSAAKDPTDPPSNTEEHMELKTEVEKDEGASENKDEDPSVKGRKAGADDDEDDEDVTENEEGFFRRTHSQATFSAVIGLSCGALVIMIIIVVAMAMRRTRPNNNTKTVLVDADSDNATEKSHLVNMQENGYENPTYRFYDY